MLVKDDFFDDIVNGLKSSAEEHIDKENSDKSGTTFGSKQLQRFKKGVVPILTDSLRNGTLIQTYVEETNARYRKIKVKELKEIFDNAWSELKEAQDEAEDELDELKDDKKGNLFLKFIKNARGIFKIVSFAIRFYGYFARVRGVFDVSKIKSDKKEHGFNLSDYNLSNELDRDKMGKDFSKYLNSTILERLKESISPFLFTMTRMLYAATDMLFNKINRSIWIWIGKQVALILWDIALTLAIDAIAVAMTASGVAAPAGIALKIANSARWVAIAARIAKFGKTVTSIYKTVARSKKVIQVINAGRKMFNGAKSLAKRGGQSTIKFLERMRRMDRGQRRELLNKVGTRAKVADMAVDVGLGSIEMFQYISADREEMLEFRSSLRQRGARFGRGVVNQITKMENFFNKMDEREDSDSNVSYISNLYSKISETNGVFVQEVQNTGLDFQIIGEMITKFKADIEIPKIDVYEPTRSNDVFNFDSFSFNTKEKTLQLQRGDKVYNLGHDLKQGTIETLKKVGVIKDNYVRLSKQDGKKLLYGTDGSLFGARLKFDSKFSLGKTIINNAFSNIVNVFFVQGETKDGQLNELSLTVEKSSGAEQKIETKKRVAGTLWGHNETTVVLKDLSDIIIPRNEWLKKEKQVLNNVKKLAFALNAL